MRKLLLLLLLALNLGAQSFDTITRNLLVRPRGTGAGETGEVRFGELRANGSNYMGMKAPDAVTSNAVYTLPNGFPGSTLCISVTTAGVWDYAACSGGSTLPVSDSTSIVEDNADGTNFYLISPPITGAS